MRMAGTGLITRSRRIFVRGEDISYEGGWEENKKGERLKIAPLFIYLKSVIINPG